MKHIFRFTLLAALLIVSSCRNTELDDLLINPNDPTPENADIEFVLANVQVQFRNFVYEMQAEVAPYVRMLAMTGGNQYNNQDTPPNFDFEWEVAYARLLTDIKLVKQLAAENGLPRYSGIAKVFEAYILMTLVDVFGDVPYSDALQGAASLSPKVDDDEAVYNQALTLLDEAITELGTAGAVPVTRIYYTDAGADAVAAKWVRVAKSLKLRAYLTTRLVNPNAKAQIDALLAEGNLISTAAEDWAFPYSTNRLNPDSRHPDYADNYDVDAVTYLSNYYMWMFFGDKGIPDPRVRFFFYRQDGNTTDEDLFTLDCPGIPRPAHYVGDYPFCVASDDGYWGRDHGNNDGIPPDGLKRTTFGVYPAAGSFDDDSFTGQGALGTRGGRGAGMAPIVLHTYVEFMKAEAALTLGTAGDPRALLESAVRKSIAHVVSFSKALVSVPASFDPDLNGETEAYVTEVLNRYDAASTPDAKLNVLMTEYYLALWGNGLDAFNNYRRTGKPEGMQPTLEPDPGPFPHLMWYPSNFVNRNSNVSQRQLTQRVFWDTGTFDLR